MAISIGDIQVVYSGGAGNTDQLLSLGGAISTAGGRRVVSQLATAPVLVTGVTIIDAFGNSPGIGTLEYTHSTSALTWRPNGVPVATGVVLSGDGIYTLGTADGYLVVSVVYASRPTANVSDGITISNAPNRTFDNVSAMQSLAGLTEYRCFYIVNTAASGIAYSPKIWIKQQPVGADTLAIALDPTKSKNEVARGPLVDEADSTNVLSGLSFSAPSSQAAGLELTSALAPGEYHHFWMRRVVPPDTTTQVINNHSSLGISALM
jgi:hypothetical protein